MSRGKRSVCYCLSRLPNMTLRSHPKEFITSLN